MAFPLEGIRVVDMTVFQQGSYSTAMLADLGADVIKIEGPDSPDPGRGVSAPNNEVGLNPYFQSHNRSKRGIVIDLKQEHGREVLCRLVESADVFVSNLRAPALKRCGADYETLKKINPALIYARASGYGPNGPDKDVASMDLLAQARSGLMSVTGEPDDPPLPAGVPLADHTGALLMAFGVMVALFHRQRTGEGQEVDSSLLAGQMCIQSFNITGSLFNGGKPQARKWRAGPTATWNVYKGSDGKWFVIGMSRIFYWPGICKVVGREDWLTDPRYSELSARLENASQLIAEFDAIFATKPADEWVRLFSEADLLAARVNEYGELAHDPQALLNGYITTVERQDGKPPIQMVGPPVTFGRTPAKIRNLAPEFGQHTEEVMVELGYGWDEIAAMRSEGAIGARETVPA